MKYHTYLLGKILSTSMSEKESTSNTKLACGLCDMPCQGDSLEPYDSCEDSFIICANCEAMSECKDLYEAKYNGNYAGPRKGVSNHSLSKGVTKIDAPVQPNKAPEEIVAN